MEYTPHGVCARKIHVELDGSIIKKVTFEGGCSGNTSGVSSLVEGMDANEAIRRLQGIRCGIKPTSCPDQLANALQQALQQ